MNKPKDKSIRLTARVLVPFDAFWPWNPDGYASYDAFGIKVDEEISIPEFNLTRVMAGYHDDGDGWDWDINMSGDGGVIAGADGYPLTFKGLRIEAAVDDAYSAHPNVLFIRFGTDDASGRLRTAESGLLTFGGSIQTLSLDGRINSILGATAYLEKLDSKARRAFHTGDFNTARSLCIQFLQKTEQNYGAFHPNTVAALNNLALGMHAQGKSSQAIALLEQALRMNKTILNNEDPRLAVSYANLAFADEKKGDAVKAALLYKQALAVAENSMPPDHPYQQFIKERLARLASAPSSAHDEADYKVKDV
ncbi:Tetratricopeptide repeat-containing protein [Desulfatibacillum alkenivorans DSM 16219]|uniref:Tetratricopeptide repeat-containing protein n=1 Tax=Desulfatibacillum alkenivorans DSM 16219 TaxID=1121393 RepID=A0A1M6HBZ5_9BACT|nr:tetratricopeptide repeat protein [Desulfatibacillum alkenivorans]SHJ19788.1 Tetratricopeptide repeat-containing protein [Desulfatibacillum alkenivorans DSM 16219]